MQIVSIKKHIKTLIDIFYGHVTYFAHLHAMQVNRGQPFKTTKVWEGVKENKKHSLANK